MTMRVPGQQWIRDVNVEDFDSRVLAASPCLVIAPVLARVVADYAGALELAKVEVDVGENMKLAGRYRVRGFPTVILFRQGEEQGRFSGAQSAPRIRHFVEQHGSISPHFSPR